MFLTAIKLKAAAFVAIAGIDTSELPGFSPDVEQVLAKLADDQNAVQKAAATGQNTSVDANRSFSEAVQKLKTLADTGDKDAQYTLAHWSLQNDSNLNETLDLYRKSAAQGQLAAKVELAQVLLQRFSQDPARGKEAVELIQEAEGKGNKVARRLLANLYITGAPNFGLTANAERAKDLLEQGSNELDSEATYMLSKMYAEGVVGIIKDAELSLKYLVRAADQKNPQAMSEYAARLFEGDGATANSGAKVLVEKNPSKAVRMFEAAAEGGSAAANRALGNIYENGMGGEKKDLKKAAQYYVKAANGNDPDGLFRLGNLYEQGLKDGEEVIVPVNLKSALDCYRLSAQAGNVQAYYSVGMFYQSGTIVDRDLSKAFSSFLRAANAGIVPAQFQVGGLYQQGGGTTQDNIAAMAWLDRAANAGYPPAQIGLGEMFEAGLGTGKPNFSAAAMQYESAADQGAAAAMLKLASLYERGFMNIKDNKPMPNLTRALAYGLLAEDASQGNGNAKLYCDQLKKTMQAADISEAQRIFESKRKK
jgi:uncharacterized protein